MTIALPITYEKYAFKGEFFEDQLVIAVTRDREDVQALLRQADTILAQVFGIYVDEIQKARRERGETRPVDLFDSKNRSASATAEAHNTDESEARLTREQTENVLDEVIDMYRNGVVKCTEFDIDLDVYDANKAERDRVRSDQ